MKHRQPLNTFQVASIVGIKRVMSMLLWLFAATTQAQPVPSATNENAVLRSAEAVVAEFKIYATCLSLEPASRGLVSEIWRKEVQEATESLTRLKATPALLLRFASAVEEARLLDRNMKLSAAMDLCHSNQETVRRFHEFGFTRLAKAVELAARPR